MAYMRNSTLLAMASAVRFAVLLKAYAPTSFIVK
jgi:hypothetical protein